MTESHPEVLEAFEDGWRLLSPEVRERWIAGGIGGRARSWRSWFEVCLEDSYHVAEPRTASLQSRLTNLIKEKLTHPGEIFGLPPMPCLKKRCCEVIGDDTVEINGEFYVDRTQLYIQDVARSAATNIICDELVKLSERLEKDINEKGLDAIRQLYPRKGPRPNDALFASLLYDYDSSSESSSYF